MMSPNSTPNLPTDLAGAGVINSSDVSMEDPENPDRIETPESPRRDSSAPAQIPSAPKVGSGKPVNVILEAMPNPRILVNPTPGSPDLLETNLGHKTLDLDSQNCIPFVTESTTKLPLESTSRKVPYLSYGEDTSGTNSSDRINSDNSDAASRSDSHNTGVGDVDTSTAKTLPAQPSVTNVAGNKSAGNDNTGTGSVSTIADFSVVGDRIFETTHPSSSNADHIATTDLPFSDSNVLSADMAFGSKVKGPISEKVGGFFNRMVNLHAVDGSSYQDKNENVNRRRRSAPIGSKTKKNIPAKVGHTAKRQPMPQMDKA